MKNTQYNTTPNVPYQPPKFGSKLSAGLILACLLSVVAVGAALMGLMSLVN